MSTLPPGLSEATVGVKMSQLSHLELRTSSRATHEAGAWLGGSSRRLWGDGNSQRWSEGGA